jgi:hypothetical protein
MRREGPFLLALGMLVLASLMVGVSGWVLYARDRLSVRGRDHHEAPEES